jgi:hypothetical protein
MRFLQHRPNPLDNLSCVASHSILLSLLLSLHPSSFLQAPHFHDDILHSSYPTSLHTSDINHLIFPLAYLDTGIIYLSHSFSCSRIPLVGPHFLVSCITSCILLIAAFGQTYSYCHCSFVTFYRTMSYSCTQWIHLITQPYKIRFMT